MIKQKGFTLMELMVAVAIIGILLAFAIPSYQSYIDKSNRVAMQTDLMLIASALERVKAIQLSYTGATLTATNIYGSSVYPKGATGTRVLYNLTLGPASTSTGVTATGGLTTDWEVSAVPTGRQVKDGMMKLNSTGQTCWNKGNNSLCNITDNTKSWRNQ